LAESASHLGWLRLLLELIDLPSLPGRLTVYGVLESFDHGFEVLEALLQGLEMRLVLGAGIGSDARFLIALVELIHRAFEHPRKTPNPPNW
jgi:hypothetical protein